MPKRQTHGYTTTTLTISDDDETNNHNHVAYMKLYSNLREVVIYHGMVPVSWTSLDVRFNRFH